MVYNTSGMKPDTRKMYALKKLPTSTFKNELKEFLGLLPVYHHSYQTYLTHTLQGLLKKDAIFLWKEHNNRYL